MSGKINIRNILNKTSTIITIIGVPSVLILYFGFRKDIKKLLKLNKSKYISKRLKDKISFNYSKNNGTYKIGKDELLFELKFSKASGDSIHIYTDPPSIEGLAIALKEENIKKIKDASKYEMSSRSETPQEGEIVILKNKYGNYCAVKIIDIKDRTKSDDKDEVTLEYCINMDGDKDFSE